MNQNPFKLAIVSWDTSTGIKSLTDWSREVKEILQKALTQAEVVVFPEYLALGAASFFDLDMERLSEFFWDQFLADIKTTLPPDKLIVMGSAPRFSGGKLYNTSPIYYKGQWVLQDKLHLTPWEQDYTPGNTLNLVKWKGLTIGNMICFDWEQPRLFAEIKKYGPHIIFGPSCTSNKIGSERVHRCASARAVELGCLSVIAPLIGKHDYEMIDHQEGQAAVYWPSQENLPVSFVSSYRARGTSIDVIEVRPSQLIELKTQTEETKPFALQDWQYSDKYKVKLAE